jgi:hypothetical protein
MHIGRFTAQQGRLSEHRTGSQGSNYKATAISPCAVKLDSATCHQEYGLGHLLRSAHRLPCRKGADSHQAPQFSVALHKTTENARSIPLYRVHFSAPLSEHSMQCKLHIAVLCARLQPRYVPTRPRSHCRTSSQGASSTHAQLAHGYGPQTELVKQATKVPDRALVALGHHRGPDAEPGDGFLP